MKKVIIFFLTVLIFFLISINIAWLKIDTLPPHWDFATHLNNIILFQNYLKTGDFIKLMTAYQYYPPLSYYLTLLGSSIFKFNEDMAVITLLPYLIILIFSIYLLGKEIGGKKLGLLSSFSLIGLPFLMSQTREYQLDYPLTSMVILNLYIIYKSKFMKNRNYSILLGITSGLAFLTKWTYLPFYFSMILGSFFINKTNKKIVVKHLLIMLFFTLFIGGWWYLINISNLKNSFFYNINIAKIEGDPIIFSIKSFLFYFRSLFENHLRLPLSIMLIISLITLIREKNRKIFFLLFNILFYLIIITFNRNKDDRFIEPITPILVLFISYWVLKIRGTVIRNILIFLLVFIAFFNFMTVTFGINFLPHQLIYSFHNINFVVYKQWGYITGPPKKEDWKIDKLIKSIPADKTVLFLLAKDKIYFNEINIDYYRRLFSKESNINVLNLKDCSGQFLFQSYNYIYLNGDYTDYQKFSCGIINKTVVYVNNYKLPDQSYLFVYKVSPMKINSIIKASDVIN